MAFANFFSSTAKPALAEPAATQQSLETPSTTPPPTSGIATPKPDPTDRRFPSILSSYFTTQVRDSFTSATAQTMGSCSPMTPAAEPELDSTMAKMDLRRSQDASSPDLMRDDFEEPVPLLPHEMMAEKHRQELPTPPLSSASSINRAKYSGDVSAAASRAQSPTSPAPSPRRPSALDSLPTSLRRATFSSPSLSKTYATAHASHISHPGLDTGILKSVSRSPSSQTSPMGSRLTSRHQTPPRSPRSQSRESRPESEKSDGGSAAIKGRLSVRISAARGLRPSIDPYVVCQFQYNEYISKGPQSDVDESERKSVPIQRSDSDRGNKPLAIPMRSRQSSQTSVSRGKAVTNPVWNHEAVFDVVGDKNEIDVSVYDHSSQEAFLGHVRFSPSFGEAQAGYDQWLKLESRAAGEQVTGEIHLQLRYAKIEKRHYGPDDFQILKLIGKGTFGQVFQVRKKDTQRVYAMKVLSKRVIVQKKEIAHTVGERNILVRTAMTDSPFIVGLKFSFQTPTDLYLVTDYMSGGELFWHLQKESRFQEDRAKFYIAELILALQHLHDHDIVYRDLKPENILLDANGHIALCDFGLSKANLSNDATTNTFCGTTEYLAPEVLLDEAGYTKMVDFWSLGVLVFEMVCGWSPFYAEDTQQMYKNIAFGKVRFPRDALSNDGRNFVKGLLNRNPKHRLGANGDAEELKAHPFFSDVDWIALGKKNVVPPFKPRLKSETDTSNFDPEFTNALNGASSLNARAAALVAGGNAAATPLSPSMQANFQGFTYVDESALEKQLPLSRTTSRTDDAMDEDSDDTAPPSPRMTRGEPMYGVQSTTEEGIFGAEM